MSNKTGDIDEIIGEKAFERVRLMVDELGRLRSVYTDTVKDITAGMKSMDNAASVKEVTTNVDNLATKTKKLNEVQTQFVETQSKVDKTIREAGDALNEYDKAVTKQILDAQKWATEEKKVQGNLKNTKASIAQVKMGWDDLNKAYKEALKNARDVSVQFGVNSKQFQEAAYNANQLKKEIDTTNKALGNYSSEVGNYSNNIVDALKKSNIGAKETKVTINDLWSGIRQLAYIIPGLGIAGIFDLAAQGASKLIEKLIEISDGAKSSTVQIDILAEALQNSDYTKAVDDVEKLRVELDLAKKGFYDKNEVVKDYNKTLGETTGYVSDLNELEQELVANGDKYIMMMLYRAAAQVAMQDAAKKLIDAEKKMFDLQKELKEGQNSEGVYKANPWQSLILTFKNGLGSDEDNLTKDVNNQVNKLKEERTQMEAIANDMLKRAGEIRSSFTKIKGVGFNSNKPNKTKEESAQERKNQQMQFLSEMDYLDSQVILMDQDRNDRLVKQAADTYKRLKDQQEKFNDELDRSLKLKQERQKQLFDSWTGLMNNAYQLQSELISIAEQQINTRLEKELAAIDKRYKAEEDAIDRLSISDKEKEERKKKLELEANARKDRIHREEVTRLRRLAIFQKNMDIGQIVANTAIAITSHMKLTPPANYIAMAADAVAGAAQVAAVLARPLPQYAKGRKGGKAEFAVVNEQGAEVVQTKDGNAYIPNEGKKGVTFLPEGASVIPHHEAIKNAAFVKLQGNKVDSNNYANALIAAYLEGTDRIEEAILKSKSSWNIYADTGVAIRYKSKIR